jgi:hypothetical protein
MPILKRQSANYRVLNMPGPCAGITAILEQGWFVPGMGHNQKK